MSTGPFAERIAEAHELYLISKGSQHEETCWNYLEAVVKLAKIAGGLQRRHFVANLPSRIGPGVQAL